MEAYLDRSTRAVRTQQRPMPGGADETARSREQGQGVRHGKNNAPSGSGARSRSGSRSRERMMEVGMMNQSPIIAVCGKGGVGKTVVSFLLARAALDAGRRPLLLVDADPVGGLSSALGESAIRTMGDVRNEIISTVRRTDPDARPDLADRLDYIVLEALVERDGYALIAMGRKEGKGCFCSVNALLRDAIDYLVRPFSAVLIDAEAGVEQIQREVTRRVSCTVVVLDDSARSLRTLDLIRGLVKLGRILVVRNRSDNPTPPDLPPGVEWAGCVPCDANVAELDAQGTPLWSLPEGSPAMVAARTLYAQIFSSVDGDG